MPDRLDFSPNASTETVYRDRDEVRESAPFAVALQPWTGFSSVAYPGRPSRLTQGLPSTCSPTSSSLWLLPQSRTTISRPRRCPRTVCRNCDYCEAVAESASRFPRGAHVEVRVITAVARESFMRNKRFGARA